jgi:hypothetical protein
MRGDAGWNPHRGHNWVVVVVVRVFVISCIVLSAPVSLPAPAPRRVHGRTAPPKQESRSPFGKRLLDGGTVVPRYVGATSSFDSFGIPPICTSVMATRA